MSGLGNPSRTGFRHADLSEIGNTGSLLDPHAIAVTVKAVSGVDGVAVRLQDQFASRECADQNQQRGLRQMEICQQLIDHAKRVAWLDENAGFRRAEARREISPRPSFSVARGAFPRRPRERARRSCPRRELGGLRGALCRSRLRPAREFRNPRNGFDAFRSPLREWAGMCRGRRPGDGNHFDAALPQFSRIAEEKCRPAVGAATAPGRAAKMVW
jgi:hypothetical protein